MSENLIPAPAKYAQVKGKASLVYDAICKVLSERSNLIDWAAFGPEEWRLFAQMAETEGVGPLLYWKLREGRGERAEGSIPKGVQDFLQASYYQTAARNAVLFSELERILAAFEQAEIPVIVLKGAALAQTLYPDPGLRPMGDVDLLVQPENLAAASRAVQALGYVQEKITYHAFLRGGRDGAVTVEIHWGQVPDGSGRTPDFGWLWGEAEPLGLASAPRMARTFRPAAQFLYLTGHQFLQNDPQQRTLIRFYDLYQLYQQQGAAVDWNALFEAEATACWSGLVQSALYRVRDLFGVQLPPKLTAQPPLPQRALSVQTTTREYIRQSWRKLGARARIQMVLSVLFPHRNYLAWRYQLKHRWLWPLYLPRRWWEMGIYLVHARE